jgi:hypothetical protein
MISYFSFDDWKFKLEIKLTIQLPTIKIQKIKIKLHLNWTWNMTMKKPLKLFNQRLYAWVINLQICKTRNLVQTLTWEF